ncbi:hypothetical protein TRVA0_015S00474 [Trichomonascus vanleenenianus]|uniref:kleisin alpha n=1 Tax=Trichomonascus vanleenenianus TaxID=2268995 RepID=UPI003ECAA5DA
MFFNESFLLKQKALAHIWLASNMEKKLKRQNYLSANLTEAVDQIKNEREGPQSLRTSGQLLFGVSTIYKRKAIYLKEDCDSTLQSLRTFKPGDVDSATTATTAARESALTLDNQITDLNFASLMPEFPQFAFEEAPMTQIPEEPFGPAAAEESIEMGRGRVEEEEHYVGDDEDLGIDFGAGLEEEGDMSIEVGREAPARREIGEDLGIEIGKEVGEDSLLAGVEGGEIEVPEMEPLDIEMPSSPELYPPTPEAEAEVEVSVAGPEEGIAPPQIEEEAVAKRRPKRAKMATQFDTRSTLAGQPEGQVERVEHPRLPSNYYDFMMYELGRNTSDFVAAMYRPSVIGLPPAIADRMFNPQTVRETMQRRLEITEEEEEEEERAAKQPRTEEEGIPGEVEFEGFEPILSDHEMEPMEMEPVAESPSVEEPFQLEFEEPVIFAAKDEESTLGTGISQNTLQAARILRTEMPTTADKSSFEVLVAGANKPDKVKMFFELLVLATKDAITINQEEPFGDIDVSTKDSLYQAPLAV